MFRIVVALYLTFVTAVGPAACCCTFSRLTDRPAEPVSAPTPPPASCCHCCANEAAPEAPAQPSEPQRPDAPGSCPCKQLGDCASVALPPAHDDALEPATRGGIAPFFCSPMSFTVLLNLQAAATPVFRESGPLGPSVSTDDLLYVFHFLRC
jgi:hypothetical protein